MKVRFKRPPDMFTMPDRIRADIRRALTVKLVVSLREFQRFLNETPVYTGRTMHNYRWSLGSPITETRAAIKEPALPGKTSGLSLGVEPRRAANQGAVESELASIIKSLGQNPFQNIYLRNNVENFSDVEYGSYGDNARTPAGGMTRRGEIALTQIIKGVRKSG